MTAPVKDDNDGAQGADGHGKPDREVTVLVGRTEVTTPRDTTPRALMILAGLDPDKRQLVKVNGKHQEPFTDPDADIHVHPGEQFITVSTGSTPVS